MTIESMGTTQFERCEALQQLAGAQLLIPRTPSVALTPGEVACLLELSLEEPTLEDILEALTK